MRILDGGFWFRGGIACVVWLARDCVSSRDNTGELASVGGIGPLFKDREKIAEFSVACSLSYYTCDD